ncbi:hypothetical protein BA78_8690 [Aspergillus fumigatus]|nr:hypothetical protein BA78_8690 [Aspergillus fumigatus]
MSSFGSSGGLGEAAAWLCLREDMYISLTSQSPLRTNLQSFERSDVFTRTDDFAWSNRMVFLLARILSCAFNEESRTRRSCASLKALEKEVDDWNQDAAEELLRYMELKTGWSTSHLIHSLREQWKNELVDD